MARFGITMGDPAGIGPEIILKALAKLAGARSGGEEAQALVIGTGRCLEEAARRLDLGVKISTSSEPLGWPEIAVLEAATTTETIEAGVLSAETGRLAYAAIERAVALALDDAIDAIVTAPISKEALHLAGHRYPGHTEILARLTGSPSSVMTLVENRLRVAHVTCHMGLADVPAHITPVRVRYVIEQLATLLADLGFDPPRIGVCALNPHAGENGLFGREEIEIITPVIEALRTDGLELTGPVPGDTVFVKALAGQYDGVVAMYHDQGHVAVKTLGFAMDAEGRMQEISGVNVTLGLPIIRTSVDHGTAFDIAGRGIANPASLIEAIEVATRLIPGRRRRLLEGAGSRRMA